MEKNLQKLRFKKFTSVPNIDRLGDYSVKIGSGKTPKGGASVYQDEGILLIRSQNVLNGQLDLKEVAFISDEINDTMRNSEVYSNDVLLNITGASIGRCAIAPERFPLANVNQHVCIIRVDEEKLSPHYVMQQILSPRIQNQINSFQAGGNREGLNFQQIRGFEIVIHDIAEQTKIADFLSTIDSRITNQSAKVDTLTELKKGIMQKIFSQEIRFKREDGGSYPNWEGKKMGDIGSIVTGTTPPTKIDEYYNDSGYPFITPSDITGKYAIKTERKISEMGIKKGRLVPKGSVLVTCIASIGKNTITIEDSSLNQQINAIVVSDKYNNEFIYYAIEKNVDKLKAASGSGTMPILNKSEFSKIRIELPQLEEQQKIADFLSTIDSKIDIETHILSTLKTLKKGLLQQMFV